MDLEISVKPDSDIQIEDIRAFFSSFVQENKALFQSGSSEILHSKIMQTVHFPSSDYYKAIEEIKANGNGELKNVYVYKMFYDDSTDDIVDNDGEILSIATQTVLPSVKFKNDWESVIFDDAEHNIKNILLKFMETSILFADNGVNSDIVTSNRIILLYGPPGTGKTTICHGLAQQLSIIYSHRFENGIILEVNTHSLFSKWFAESGKMVKKLFDRLNEIASDTSVIVFVLIDEVESLATARQSSMNGSDPSDAIRVVNALLTQLDQLRKKTNVIIMATSNLTECIDFAFLSRADIKQYIGPPSKAARYMILKSCVLELVGKGIIDPVYDLLDWDKVSMLSESVIQSSFKSTYDLLNSATLCEGLCGRVLRRLPFLAFVYEKLDFPVSFEIFINALNHAIEQQNVTNKEASQVT